MYTKVGDGLQVISGDIVKTLVSLENLTVDQQIIS